MKQFCINSFRLIGQIFLGSADWSVIGENSKLWLRKTQISCFIWPGPTNQFFWINSCSPIGQIFLGAADWLIGDRNVISTATTVSREYRFRTCTVVPAEFQPVFSFAYWASANDWEATQTWQMFLSSLWWPAKGQDSCRHSTRKREIWPCDQRGRHSGRGDIRGGVTSQRGVAFPWGVMHQWGGDKSQGGWHFPGWGVTSWFVTRNGLFCLLIVALLFSLQVSGRSYLQCARVRSVSPSPFVRFALRVGFSWVFQQLNRVCVTSRTTFWPRPRSHRTRNTLQQA